MASLPCNARIQLTDTLEQMQQGALMRKVKSKSWKKQRYFKLQDDCMTIWYQSKRTGKTESAFSISDVETVREGHQSEVLQSLAEEFPPERCFTIVFYGRRGNLDLIAGSAEEAQCWVQGLRQLIEVATSMDQRERIDQWIRDWFQKADKNKDGRMNFKEVQRLLKMMNVDMNEDHALRLFQAADKSESGTLEGEEFVLFYKALTEREEVLSLFQAFSEDGKKLTLLELVDFLRQEQLEDEGTEELAMELIDKYEPSETARARHALSADGFLMYLCSPEGSIFNPRHQVLWQDMTQPLCHYFISSSHNTYLIEDQIRGQSSIEGYIRALKRGCRCLEVDCWDGPNGEPMVYHGHTFTSKIPFREVVSTLGKYAFQASDYPVILSLENHCSMEQQEVLAQQLRDILGEQLLTATVDGRVPTQLPSPEELKHKILLKGKKIGRLEDVLDGPGDEAPDVSDDDNGAEAEEERRRMKKDKESLAQALSDCVVYCKSVSFRGFQEARSHSRPSEISSLAEAKARKLIRDAGNDFVRHNAWQLTRIYPSGMRTDSSNYSPQEMWNAGCQIVALNFQTAGTEMDLCDGLFSQNGRCGYVLKPPFMRDEGTLFNPGEPSTREGPGPVTLTIQVISGQQLPKVANSKDGAIIDPLVRVEIHGVPADQAHQETKYIENNGFNPRWDETLQFQLHVPELALVRFVVEDYDKTSRNDFVGQFTLAFANIKPGERPLPGGVGCWAGGAWLGARERGGQPRPRCPPCRLPPHPPPLQGRHQHPALLALRPHPHRRDARPRAGLTRGASGTRMEAIGPARFWPHAAGATGLSTPPPRRSVCVVPVSSSLLCPCLQWPPGAGERHRCLHQFGMSPALPSQALVRGLCWCVAPPASSWPRQGSATGRRRAGARRPCSAGGLVPPTQGKRGWSQANPGAGQSWERSRCSLPPTLQRPQSPWPPQPQGCSWPAPRY
uniref:Phosphoinositide phospholipase C n=1 Tax=Anser cygnoides TaxID=8845 RepID=A0A8B9IGW3_ANSCY